MNKKIRHIDLKRARIAVVYGGISKERPGSLVSGQTVFNSLKRQGFDVFAVDPKLDNLYQKLKNADVAFLILHGRYGEDGKIQGFLEAMQISYVGSGVLASAIGMDKLMFKELLASQKILTPRYETIDLRQNLEKEAKRVIKKLGLPVFLKPISEGGSLGSAVIHVENQLIEAIRKEIGKGFDGFLVEEYIKGRSVTVGILERDGKPTCLPILETISKKEFYDYEAKHDPNLHIYRCPAPILKTVYQRIQNISLQIHLLLRCHGFSRVDFIIDKYRSFVLEINTLPGLSPQSNMATMAKAAGLSYDQLVLTILKTIWTKPNYLP
ncbi:MAG: D-alanine--D-alanine ligase [bacterium]|nr:D-alanine--D-alanine ligase [bacterium]